MDIIKICLLGFSGVMLGFLLKSAKPEYVCFISLGIGIIIMGLAVGKIRILFEFFEKINHTISLQEIYFPVLLKMVAITYIGQFSAGICKDSGYHTMGDQIDLFCRLSIMILSMPVLLALLETIQEFLT